MALGLPLDRYFLPRKPTAFHRPEKLLSDAMGLAIREQEVVAVLLADGWHSLSPHQAEHDARLRVRRTHPAELATELAPVLAQVTA